MCVFESVCAEDGGLKAGRVLKAAGVFIRKADLRCRASSPSPPNSSDDSSVIVSSVTVNAARAGKRKENWKKTQPQSPEMTGFSHVQTGTAQTL